jgi:hypothetical protein
MQPPVQAGALKKCFSVEDSIGYSLKKSS